MLNEVEEKEKAKGKEAAERDKDDPKKTDAYTAHGVDVKVECVGGRIKWTETDALKKCQVTKERNNETDKGDTKKKGLTPRWTQ
jgi:hypothetical protein